MNLQDLWAKLKATLNNPGAARQQQAIGQQTQASGRPTTTAELVQQMQAGQQQQNPQVQQAQQLGQQQMAQQAQRAQQMQASQGAGGAVQMLQGQQPQPQQMNPYLAQFLQLLRGRAQGQMPQQTPGRLNGR